MPTKICIRCKIEKEVEMFTKDKRRSDGLMCYCKKCRAAFYLVRNRIYRQTHPGVSKEWRKDYNAKYFVAKPWAKTMVAIHQRCKNPKCASYSSYGGKGITSDLTLKDLENLWIRDSAGNMLEPSIDRIDGIKNYTFSNCRYMELPDNKRKLRDR